MAIVIKLACLVCLATMGHIEATTVVDVLTSDAEERFTVLASALQAQDLVTTLSGDGPFTVFAPTNAAFEALGMTDEQLMALENLGDILTYHVVSGSIMSSALSNGQRAATVEGSPITVSIDGSTVMIDDATVTAADITADNGVIHIIDKVIMPSNTVVDVAVNDAEDRFTTLYAALASKGLLPTLSGAGPFTVFAPTNAAFEALGMTEQELMALDNLDEILQYHVISGEVLSSQLTNGQTAATLQGSDVTVTIDGTTVMINDATVTAADLNAGNGVVHVIDTVLTLPAAGDSTDSTASSSTSTDASGARAPAALVGIVLASLSALMA